ncbi:hypothetical protein J2W56_005501 [Nocardia kruczakiae]|uniref:Cutinase n=1 Tax=Nocardia kruczakiae TaxID=261477 RepID=A0ABU1XMF1_9NOCA|nr:cutinase family protein [Nocardia kruczakiae]MDR7171740.1 hypothetical protein [Nocardia kruczakiae]
MNGSRTATAQRRTRRPRAVLRRMAGAVVCAATMLAAGAYIVPTVAGAAPEPDCAKIAAVLVRGVDNPTGTAETSGSSSSVLDPVARALQVRYGSDLTVVTVSSSASDSPIAGAPDSGATQAVSSVLSSLCSTTRVILLGYADGARVAGDLAGRIGHGQGPVPASRVLAVALLGDPRRDSSTPQLGESAGGQGVEGPRTQDFGELTDRVRTLCAPGDLYCSVSLHTDPAITALGHALSGRVVSPASDTGTVPAPVIPDSTSEPTTATQASPDSLPARAGVLDGLDPSEIIGQAATVLSALAAFAGNIPAIVNDLAQLPGLIGSGNVAGLHRVSGDLNNQCAPLVQAVADVDLHLVARALALAAPLDASGWTAIASQIVGILANVDIGRLATDIGQTQEIAWDAVQKLTTGDPAGAALALTGLAPIGADLVTTAASALTGDGGARLSSLGRSFTTATTPEIRAGLSELTSGIHEDGYTAETLGSVLDWLSGRMAPVK